MPKYVVVTGGVMSGLGKGILSASIGRLLKSCGYRVSLIKMDPYLNQDAGTLSPFEHGEVFVLDDGAEVDLDFGHYERFIDDHLNANHNITTGKIYSKVVQEERAGEYLGKTVQIVPHITNKIKNMIISVGKKFDVTIIELGGTVGDIEGLPFIEALRQLKKNKDLINIHLTFVPSYGDEQKTKPTQHSVISLRRLGIMPDIIVGRSEKKLSKKVKQKISLFCDVEPKAVIDNPDLSCVYSLPLELKNRELHIIIQKNLGLDLHKPKLRDWKGFVDRVGTGKKTIVGIIGKYGKGDTYLSIQEALTHAGASIGLRPE
ncbi:MAG: CTP synthase, partial [Candidatus Altiarchaeota archaeon]|nr:CTP synthase [Candidatus Altiarchaeota archaeon]